MATQADNKKMKLVGVAVGILLLASAGYFFLSSDARSEPQANVKRSSEGVVDDTLADSSDVPTRGSGKRDGDSSRSRVQAAAEVGEEAADEQDTELQSKKKAVQKRPRRHQTRGRAEEEDEEESTSGTAKSPPRPF